MRFVEKQTEVCEDNPQFLPAVGILKLAQKITTQLVLDGQEQRRYQVNNFNRMLQITYEKSQDKHILLNHSLQILLILRNYNGPHSKHRALVEQLLKPRREYYGTIHTLSETR